MSRICRLAVRSFATPTPGTGVVARMRRTRGEGSGTRGASLLEATAGAVESASLPWLSVEVRRAEESVARRMY